MKPTLEITRLNGASSLSALMSALEEAAVAHAVALHIDHDRMLRDFGCLWMVVRCRLRVTRMPEGTFTVRTWLRKPTAALSNRDFSICDAQGELGSAVQTWVLADAAERRIIPMKSVEPLWTLPTPEPERTDALRRLALPENMTESARWTVQPQEIDSNGHLNNVAYIHHAEALAPKGCTLLEVVFDRECFAGETLTLETAQADGFFVRGLKENGEESFRARFWKENMQ